ncbi:hypothetical protein CVT25_012706 [Psilocybe cyanescens]|uniref:Uncharacterized protein n=1 Tax=Psilocybe cyanescens TaxID=93625 RepID=A0A409VN71_PSICY|nr:hypothetical protein CVT25_012706 [Psilocybe cyanescens]
MITPRVTQEEDDALYHRWVSGEYHFVFCNLLKAYEHDKKFTDDTHHRDVKPHILSVFSFTNLCGSNPFVEKDGIVYPGATEANLKKLEKCTNANPITVNNDCDFPDSTFFIIEHILH